MKRSEIKVGETYGYTTWINRNGRYTNLSRITVTGFEQKRVRNRTSYGTRLTTVAVGTGPSSDAVIEVETKYIIEPYAQWKSRQDETAKWRAEAQAKQEQAEAERTPLVAALGERLAEAGYTDLQRYEHLKSNAVRSGKVEIPVQVLADLLGITVDA